ncbi:MAG: HD domain-containing protein [bacterium]
MKQDEIIKKTVEFVRYELDSEGSHDWWHIYRVWHMAKKLAKLEHADMFIVELAALLHDIADRKLNNGDEQAGLQKVRTYLSTCVENATTIDAIVHIIETYSYTNHLKHKKGMDTLEGQVVQDADRLDAIGAIGIARTFSYGGHARRPLYDPAIKPRRNVTTSEYTNAPSPSLNHFHEKLLLLTDLMNTQTAKKIAKGRHIYMEEFMKQFLMEWNSEDLI